jgi:YedE family putative selenium metabolism protein
LNFAPCIKFGGILTRDCGFLKGFAGHQGAPILQQFKASFTNQPIAHDNGLWNFAGMVLSGLAFTLAFGCPGRQMFLSGEGDGDAAIFVFGMIVGAGFSHNFYLARSPAGPGVYGPAAVIIGLIASIVICLAMRDRSPAV